MSNNKDTIHSDKFGELIKFRETIDYKSKSQIITFLAETFSSKFTLNQIKHIIFNGFYHTLHKINIESLI